uniref:Wall-associated receptor kinase C-terminal domain-containing protein n=1 Tax=Setaria italica TaxID=4555 RepID=A0A0Q3PME3_SETIT
APWSVSHDVSFDEVWLRYSTSSKDNLTFFFGCDPAPAGLDMYRIDCNGLKSPFDDGASFVLTPDHGKAQEHNLAAYCKNLSVPVRSEVLKSSNKTSFTSGGYGDVLRQGFELAWLPTDECHPCEQSGGKCSYNQYRQFLGCLCSSNIKVGHPRRNSCDALCYGEKVGNPDCKNRGSSIAYTSNKPLNRQKNYSV